MRSKLAKKRSKKRQTKTTVGRKLAPMKKAIEIKPALRKVTPKKAEVKSKASGKATTGEKTADALEEQVRPKSQSVETVPFGQEGLGARSGEQSGDLQGLSNVEGADSESVDELLEEGNAFEADAVKGVEDAEDADEVEVHIHEVPQDDVPGEYLDKE
jgi:hypothetical protein